MHSICTSCILLYIDPGTGSYLAQVVIAAVLGLMYYFKAIKYFFVRLLRKITGKEQSKHE